MNDAKEEIVSGNWTGRGLPASDAANAIKRSLYWGGGVGGLVGATTAQGHWLLAAVVIGLVLTIWMVGRLYQRSSRKS